MKNFLTFGPMEIHVGSNSTGMQLGVQEGNSRVLTLRNLGLQLKRIKTKSKKQISRMYKGCAAPFAALSTAVLSASTDGDGASAASSGDGPGGGGSSSGDGDADGDGDPDSDRPASKSSAKKTHPVTRSARNPAVLSSYHSSSRPRRSAPPPAKKLTYRRIDTSAPPRYSDHNLKDRRRSWLAFLLVIISVATAILFALLDKDDLASQILTTTIPMILGTYLVSRSKKK